MRQIQRRAPLEIPASAPSIPVLVAAGLRRHLPRARWTRRRRPMSNSSGSRLRRSAPESIDVAARAPRSHGFTPPPPRAAPRATSSTSSGSVPTRRAPSRRCFPVPRARVPACLLPPAATPFLLGQFTESSGEIKFPEISTPILEKVIQYFYYKLRYTNSQVRIPEFNIEPEMALELLMASNFLDC